VGERIPSEHLAANKIVIAIETACVSLVVVLESLGMAKAKRIPLNRLVKPETFETVKMLAEALERSEGEIIDQSVKFFEAHQGGEEGRVVVSYPTPQASGSTSPQTESPKTGLRCNHCPQRRFTGSKYLSICGECQEAGHRADPRNCKECADQSVTGAI
jgi:hypothetical protein